MKNQNQNAQNTKNGKAEQNSKKSHEKAEPQAKATNCNHSDK